MLNVVNVSPVAFPALTAHAPRTRPHPLARMWLCTCAECEDLLRVACIDLIHLWPLLHSFSFLFSFPFSLSSYRCEMADGPSPKFDLVITNLHN